jgi:hypothetical protein
MMTPIYQASGRAARGKPGDTRRQKPNDVSCRWRKPKLSVSDQFAEAARQRGTDLKIAMRIIAMHSTRLLPTRSRMS